MKVCDPYQILYTFFLCCFLLLQIWASYMLVVILTKTAWLLFVSSGWKMFSCEDFCFFFIPLPLTGWDVRH